MILDQRVQTLEHRIGPAAGQITTVEIVGVPSTRGGDPGPVLTCTLGRDRHFTLKPGASL